MAQKKIKCVVYESKEPWGGGHYFLPLKNHKEIHAFLLEDHKISKTPKGTFEFEVAFLDEIFGRQTWLAEWQKNENLNYWEDTWCE